MKEKLYHYCSINTLELILKNQTIRFSSLGTVDDMEESLTEEDSNLGKVCFISCWTDLEKETAEMWRGYTDMGKGVRISLPKDLFKEAPEEKDALLTFYDIRDTYDISLSPPYTPILSPVTYTKDNTLIKLSVLKKHEEVCNNCGNQSYSLNFNTKLLGKFKRNIWESQSEWRYLLLAIPNQYHRNHVEGKYQDGDLEQRLSLMESDLRSLEFKSDFIDYEFNKNILNSLEVLTGPLNSEEDNQNVQIIIDKYIQDTKVSIKKSTIQLRR